MNTSIQDHARAIGAWLKSKPLHIAVPLAVFSAILLIAGLTAIPHRHVSATSITSTVRAASFAPAPTPAAVQSAAPVPAPAAVSPLTPPAGVAAGHVRVELERQDQLGQYSSVRPVKRDAQSASLAGLPVEAGAPAARESIAGWLALPALATIASLSIAGAGQASAMIDGKVSVQPGAAAAGEIQKGAQL